MYEDGTIVGFDVAMSTSGLTLPNSGATIQITTPAGVLADTVAYGNGPIDVEGWSGISLVEPVSSLSLLVYHRGDGCGNLPDTDVALDWQHRTEGGARVGDSVHDRASKLWARRAGGADDLVGAVHDELRGARR